CQFDEPKDTSHRATYFMRRKKCKFDELLILNFYFLRAFKNEFFKTLIHLRHFKVQFDQINLRLFIYPVEVVKFNSEDDRQYQDEAHSDDRHGLASYNFFLKA